MATSEFIFKNASQPSDPKISVRGRASSPAFASGLLFMLGDVFVITFSFAVAIFLKVRFFEGYGPLRTLHEDAWPAYLAFFGWFLGAILLVFRRYGLYSSTGTLSGAKELRLTVQGVLNAGLLLCGGLYMTQWNDASRLLVVLLTGTTMFDLSIWRAVMRLRRYRHYEHGINTRNVVVLGTNYLSYALGQHISGNYRLGYQFLGYIDPSQENDGSRVVPEVLGGLERLHHLTRLHFIDEVVIAQALSTEHVIQLLEEARELGIDIRAISGLYGDLASNAAIEYCGVYPVTVLHRRQSRTLSLFFKRVADILLSLSGILIASPFMLLIALAVRLDDDGPIFYVSERIGKRGRVFPCFKFRTMVKDAEKKKKELATLNERDGILFKMKNDPRITRVGRFLRKYSLDELPQLFNVFRGEMSLVGPRPPIASEVAKYELEHFRRLEVMPGLTGLWQVQARQDGSFAKYIELDTAYVENWSFWLDIKILIRTAHVVLRGTGS